MLELDARLTLRTDGNKLIYVRAGRVRYTPEGGELYSRIVPVFDTDSERYGWLNHIVAVGVGRTDAAREIFRKNPTVCGTLAPAGSGEIDEPLGLSRPIN